MTIEKQSRRDQINQESNPTNLHLFRAEDKGGKIGELSSGVAHFKRQLMEANTKADSMVTELDGRASRIIGVLGERQELAFQYVSQITASNSYLKIHEELSARGVREPDINEFFLKCFYINSKVSERYEDDKKSTEQLFVDSKGNNSKIGILVRKVAGNPSRWFNSSKGEWYDFVANHASFYSYLNSTRGFRTHKITQKLLGYTSTRFVPDWFEKLNEGELQKIDVETELAEDILEHDEVIDYMVNLEDRLASLYTHYNSRYSKSAVRFEDKRREMKSRVGNLSELTIFLKATEDTHELPGDIEELEQLSSMQLDTRRLSPDQSREKSIIDFVNTSPLPIGIVALWVEKKFKEANLLPFQIIDQELVQKLNLFTEDNSAELKTFRESDKKFFKFMNYELKPILLSLTEDGQEYLSELISDSVGDNLESIIWEIAYVFSSRIGDFSHDESIDEKAEEIKRFGANWIRNNWKRIHSEMDNAEVENLNNQNSFDTLAEDDNEDEDIRTIEVLKKEDSEDIRKWNIFYTTNRRVKSGAELVPIEGENNQEMEESLEKILVREGGQVSIKNSSVVNALEWITTIPDDVLARWPEKVVNGESFKKVKRGAARILFQIDKDSKSLGFYLHQKKEWTYGY